MDNTSDRADVASLRVAQPARHPSSRPRAAYRAIFERHTDRRKPSSLPVPRKWLDELTGIGARHGALVTALRDRYDEEVTRDLRQVAALLQHEGEEYLKELSLWTGSTGDEGVPQGSVVAAPSPDRPQSPIETRFTYGLLRDTPSDGEAPSPSWLLLATSSDDNLSRLRAGEALSALRVAVPPASRPRIPRTRRRAVADVLDHDQAPGLATA